MNETSTIDWINIIDKKPKQSGWYMVVLRPRNYIDFKDNPGLMNSWITNFGINKLWWHNCAFWDGHVKVTDRVICWGELPNVPLCK